MAAYSHVSCHVKKEGEGPDAAHGEQPSVVVGVKRVCGDDDGDKLGGFAAAPNSTNRSPSSFNDFKDSAGPMLKKAKVHHLVKSLACPKSYAVAAAAVANHGGDSLRMPSPTDVRSHDGWGSQAQATPAKIQATAQMNGQHGQIKTFPPTLKGIIDAATVLNASKLSSSGGGKENAGDSAKQPHMSNSNAATAPMPLLLSFPTESVYMLACCVKTASSRSIRKLLSRRDSQTSLSSSCSSEKGCNADPPSYEDSIATHQGGSLSLMDSIHPQNASLEWLIKCNERAKTDLASDKAPFLFVLDANHALNFCHFTKPKTYAIRPPSLSLDNTKKSEAVAPSTPPKGSSTKENSFSPLPVFGVNKSPTALPLEAPLTPKPMTSGSISPPSSPGSPKNQKLCAATFSESREAFLRLASKFWPGPVVFHVQVRMLGGEDVSGSHIESYKRSSSASSSNVSLPSLASAGDLVAVGKLRPSTEPACVPVLPPSALIPASQLIAGQDEGQDNDRYFVGMQCPSHPLPRKILNEVYSAPARPSNAHPNVASSLSTDDSISGENKVSQHKVPCKNGRARSSIAVMGCMVPGPKSAIKNNPDKANSPASPASGATTAADVDRVMTPMVQSTSTNNAQEKQGRVFIVNGEDNRESFTVPTCQYGRPHPVSVVIDGDSRTIHLRRHCHGEAAKNTKESRLTKDSVYRALLKPASPSTSRQSMNLVRSHSHNGISEKKGDSNSIDRVITAVLSRWKIQESIISS